MKEVIGCEEFSSILDSGKNLFVPELAGMGEDIPILPAREEINILIVFTI